MNGANPDSPKSVLTTEQALKQPLLAELVNQSHNMKYQFSDYTSLWFTNITDAMGTQLPSLAFGKLTPEQFAENLTATALKNTK
ncbi:MAG TPA: hypothetical protein VIK78_04470 [Ruminiclostridium sp.]